MTNFDKLLEQIKKIHIQCLVFACLLFSVCVFSLCLSFSLSFQRLCRALLGALARVAQSRCKSTCLETLRILSRDKCVLGPVTTREGILTLAGLARIGPNDASPEAGSRDEEQEEENEEERVAVEALKCLCNIVFNSVQAQQVGADVQLAQGLCTRLRAAGGGAAPHEVGLFSLRLLFLLSALRSDVRSALRKEPRVIALLTDVLERALDVRWAGPYEVAPPDPQAPPIPSQENERAVEALKALFNITLSDSNDEVSRMY